MITNIAKLIEIKDFFNVFPRLRDFLFDVFYVYGGEWFLNSDIHH